MTHNESSHPLPLPPVKVFIAISLDGFIADTNDSVDWLTGFPSVPEDGDYGYAEHMKGVGGVMLGRKTYEQILSFGKDAWTYGDRPVFVFTRNVTLSQRPEDRSTVSYVDGDIVERLREMKEKIEDGKQVYVDGSLLMNLSHAHPN